MKLAGVLIVGVVVLSFSLSLIAYPMMPDLMASHWGVNGVPNGFMSKNFALFVMPVMAGFLAILFKVLPNLDPLKKNYKKFRVYYDLLILIIVLFLFYLHLLMILWNSGLVFDMTQLLAPAFAGLLFYLGILMENAEQNWFVGFRTPWTLSSKKVWKKTHERGSVLFKVCSAFAFAGVLYPGFALWLFMVPLLFSVGYLFVYSFWLFKKK